MFQKSTKITDLWSTPKSLFYKLDAEFAFTCDPASTKENAKCSKFFTEEDDGLCKSWKGERIFLNPPYSSDLQKAFVKKAFEESRDNGVTSVLLLPARSDTKLFHEYCMKASEIRFIKGRVKFDLPPGSTSKQNSAPFPSMLVIFKGWQAGSSIPPQISTYTLPKVAKATKAKKTK